EKHTLDQLQEAEPGVFELSPEAAQTLMDDLWASGVRPSEKRQDGAALEAVKYHLEDMRRLVFTKIDAFMGPPREEGA
nr:hypothetical protein [Anaerolineae bacterium]